ncbi:MAG: hypothetical protein PHG44_05175 [Lentisphaeria bacterium]|nr:hypothetical protein [Lentisphaeria bacterium]
MAGSGVAIWHINRTNRTYRSDESDESDISIRSGGVGAPASLPAYNQLR